MKTVVMFQSRHAYVNAYYSGKNWKKVPPWDTLETPVIAHGHEDPKKHDRFLFPGDVKPGPVYDETSCLMGYLVEETVSFEELEAVAESLGWGKTFDKRVLVFVGGTNPLRPALMTGAGLQPFSSSWDANFWEKRLEEKGFDGVWATGKNAVVFEVDESPQQGQGNTNESR